MSEMWDSVASNWEQNADFVDAHLAAATKLLLDRVAVGQGDTVLDLACGPGGAGIAAAALVGESGSVLLADDAPEMVAAAGRRGARLPQVSTAVFDQAVIDAAEGTFDAVIARHGLMFAEDPVLAVREARRVLRPGGRYGTITWSAREANPWLGLILDAVGEQFGVIFPPPGIPGPFSLDTRERIAAVLGEAGLEEVAVEEVDAPMRVASLEDWWERVPRLAGPLAQALAGMEPEVRREIGDRALAAAAAVAREADGDVELDGSVLVAWGERR